MRSPSERKLSEIEALLERTRAMKGWLEVAKECGCATPEECALFPAPGGGRSIPIVPRGDSGRGERLSAAGSELTAWSAGPLATPTPSPQRSRTPACP